MNSAHEAQAAKERVIKDFKAVVVDTEELLKATANQTGDRITAARATDQLVHENPWQSVGVAAAVGFLLGMLIHRRD